MTRTVACAVGLAAIAAAPLAAQVVRVSGVTTLQYVDVRPLEEDSLPVADAVGSGLLRRSPDGYVVRCLTGDAFCRYRRETSIASTLPAAQDIDVNVWGFGRGIRAYGRLRGRTMLVGNETFWPRSDDHFDVMAAYVEIDRSRVRARLGRQWTTGLGFYNYDGASVVVRPGGPLRLEAYGGRSLARGINEPVTTAELQAVESFAPDVGAVLLGVRVGVRPNRRGGLEARYQREIRTDRLGLYSERVAVDGFLRLGSHAIDGSLKVDWATNTVNEGRVRFSLAPVGPVALNAFVRHYRPYFDLWTIWGAFTPLSYNEAGVTASWRRRGAPLAVDVWGAHRAYVGTEAEALFGNVRSDGWRLGAAARLPVAADWSLSSQYRAEFGFGAARSDFTVRAQHDFAQADFVAVNVSAFQRLYELRVNDGVVWAVGGEAGVRSTARTRLMGSLTAYHHTPTGDAPAEGWTQLRGSLRIEWTLGAEPGLTTGVGGLR